jgi:hypothetical protein
VRRTIWTFLLLLAITSGFAGCGNGGGETERGRQAQEMSQPRDKRETSEAARPRLADQWAGRVEGTNAYISVFTLDDGQAGAYLADGQRIATLVLGRIDNETLDLEPARGTTVAGTVRGDMVDGTATIDGAQHPFSAQKATGTAGWYRGRATIGGQAVAAGYIILADGSQKGAVRRGEEILATPTFDPANPIIEVEGGSVTVRPVAEFVEQEGGLS